MEFEYDTTKNKSNYKKHKIDFVTVQRLWDDKNRIEIPAKVIGEKRFMIIGKIDNDIWSAIFTIRKNKIRIISARKASKNEKEIYKN